MHHSSFRKDSFLPERIGGRGCFKMFLTFHVLKRGMLQQLHLTISNFFSDIPILKEKTQRVSFIPHITVGFLFSRLHPRGFRMVPPSAFRVRRRVSLLLTHIPQHLSYSSHTSSHTHNSSFHATHLTPLILHISSHATHLTHPISLHSSHSTHLTLLVSHHSSHATHLTSHLTLLTSHHLSHTTHLAPLISQHSSHTTHLAPFISYQTHFKLKHT